MRRRSVLVVCSALLIFGTAAMIFAGERAASVADNVKIAALVTDMQGVSAAKLQAMKALAAKPYTLPEPSVDVMRARLTETYTISGIGQDTVELSGWIAVTHGKPSTNDWNTAVTETRFVALDLNGESKVFGPVHVTFDPEKQVVGAVGRIPLPDKARMVLAAAQPAKTKAAKPAKGQPDGAVVDASGNAALVCRAPVTVAVAMPKLDLKMETREPATWFSLVNTIPPVGQTASVTVDPVALVTRDGREVGTLDSGRVLFRETVRHVALSNDLDVSRITTAASKPAGAARPATALHR